MTDSPVSAARPRLALLLAAFAAVYVVWGSTYLAIRFAIETLPGFSMGGARFLVAGALLYGWARARGAPPPTVAETRAAGVVGALLLFVGNGAVVWAERTVPSGLAALLVACVPMWMVLLDWARPGGPRPTGVVVGGLVLGLVGIAILVGPDRLAGGGRVDLPGAGAVLLGTLAWASGSIYSRTAPKPESTLIGVAVQMLIGGVLLLAAGGLVGEWGAFRPVEVSLRSWLALAYLVVFGSLVAYTAYAWLLRVTTPARASSYAYVNPVVAVLLGWALAGEPLTARVLAAGAAVVVAVVLLTTARK